MDSVMDLDKFDRELQKISESMCMPFEYLNHAFIEFGMVFGNIILDNLDYRSLLAVIHPKKKRRGKKWKGYPK